MPTSYTQTGIGAFTSSRDNTQFRRGGGRRLWAKEVDPITGADFATPKTWYDMGWIRATTPSIKLGSIQELDEGGVIALSSRQAFPTVSIKTTLMQAGIDLLLMASRTEGKAFRIYYEYARQNQRVVEYLFAVCTFASDIEIPADPSKINDTVIEFTVAPAASATLLGSMPGIYRTDHFADGNSSPVGFLIGDNWGTDNHFSQYRVYTTELY